MNLKNKKMAQSGRTMIELLGSLAVMGLLGVGTISAFTAVMNRFRANNLLDEAGGRAIYLTAQFEKGRKNVTLGKFTTNDVIGGVFSQRVFTLGLSGQFGIQVSDVNKAVCERLLNSIEDTTPLRRLSLVNSPTVAITKCNDENTFLMIYNAKVKGSESDTSYHCESDADCDTICATCNENNQCVGECELPVPDINEYGQECGTNECIRYDEETQSCQYACERVEYLESTGSPYIDTGIKPTDEYGYRIKNTYRYGGGEQCAIGCMDVNNRFVGIYTGGRQVSGGWGSFVEYLRASYNFTDDTIWDISCNYKNDRSIVLNGEFLKDLTDIHITGEISSTLYLFARHYGNNITRTFSKIYSVEITKGSDIFADFIPVISPYGEPCMFDKISQKLFCNSGSGDFKTNLDE